MISILIGTLQEISPPHVIINVAGVGYEVALPFSNFTQLPGINHQATLYTHLVVREDAHSLYGFIHKSERDCFRQLIKVSGIGPKIGLALLSTMTSQELILAVENGDCDRLCLTPGIGKKMAERAILELKGKLQTSLEFTPSQGLFAAPATTPNSIRTDISNALESLGYSTKEITLVLKQLPEVSDLSSGIKQALKILSSK